jgi:Asp-tRNA(Asn)/Glu-tRNA(Gln) amidotransferase A subunit family amidase
LPEGQVAHAITILSEISDFVQGDVKGLTNANKVLISVGLKTPASDFILAQRMRNLLMRHLAALFKEYPGLVIVTPTTPCAGWHISGGKGDLKYGISDANMSMRSMEYVWLANFTGTPSLSLPVGYVDPVAEAGTGKIPIGLMGTGEWGSDDDLIEWGRDGEKWLNEGYTGGRQRPSNWDDVVKLAGGDNQA